MDYRSEFAEFDDVTYLDAAAQGPLPNVAERAAKKALEWKRLPHKIPVDAYAELPNRVRRAIGKLLHAQPDDIAITTGASTGLSVVATGMDWKPGDEILVGQGEFPAHFAAWLPVEKAGLAQVKRVQPRERFLDAEDYEARMGPRTRVVSVSLVRFSDSVRFDAARLATACRRSGAALLLDVSQCAGAMPLDVNALGADFVCGAGYKWLLGSYGTGFFWAQREWTERLGLGPLYWTALEGAEKHHGLPMEGLRVVAGARRWDTPETANFTSMAAWAESLELVLRATPEAIAEHDWGLGEHLIKRLPSDRCVLMSPREAEKRGPFVCIAGRSGESTMVLYEKLRAEKVIVSLRENALRIAPHFYNAQRDIDRLAHLLTI
jgi:cysteine desulfurase/selenocysteine lyase